MTFLKMENPTCNRERGAKGCQGCGTSPVSFTAFLVQSEAVSRLCVVFKDTYNIGKRCSWWHSIDMDCILFPMKFEGRFSLSVLRKKIILYRKVEFKTEDFFFFFFFSQAKSCPSVTHADQKCLSATNGGYYAYQKSCVMYIQFLLTTVVVNKEYKVKKSKLE